MNEDQLPGVSPHLLDDPEKVEVLAKRLDARFPHLREQEVDEWVQHLVDLGYLEESESGEASTVAADGRFSLVLLAAIERMHDENPFLTSQGMPNGLLLEPRGFVSNVTPPRPQPSMIELDELSRLTSFDGEFSFSADALPPEGETNLHSRSLHFHLGALGLYDLPTYCAHGCETEDALDLLAYLLSKGPEQMFSLDGVMEAINDVSALSERFIESHGSVPLVFGNGVDHTEGRDYASLVIVNGRFLEGKDIDRLPGLNEDSRESILKELEDRSEAEARVYSPVNQLGLRLVQLRLWMHGFYRGRLDGWWGPASRAALEEALKFEELDLEDALVRLNGGYWAVNAGYVFDLLFDRLDAARLTIEEYDDAIVRESEYLVSRGFDKDEVREEDREKKQALKLIWESVRDAFKGLVNIGKRIYHGARTLVLSAMRGIMKGIRWITGSLSDLVGPVIAFTRSFFKRVRQGIGVFTESLPRLFHFVLRRPMVTRDNAGVHFALSRFDLDADAKLYVSEGADPGLGVEHARLTRALARGATILLIVAVKVAKTIVGLLGGPVGWLRLGFEVGKAVLSVLRNTSIEHLSAIS